LKYLLTNLVEIAETLHFIKSYELLEIEYLKDNWQDDIIQSYKVIKKTLNNIYLQNISMPTIIKSRQLQRLRTHRNRIYRNEILNCYQLYNKIFTKNDLNTIKTIIGNQLLKPSKDIDLFEIYVLFNIIDQLNYKLKDKSNANLDVNLIMAKYKKQYTAKYEDLETTIKVYYQQLPPIFAQNSKYKDIFQNYDLNVNTRLPDIIIEYQTTNGIYYQIIEVKLTNNRDYIVDSVYKLLGYLKDFECIMNKTNNPKGILVVWGGINPIDTSTNEISILNNSQMKLKGFELCII